MIYSDAQIQAAKLLIELLLPTGKELNEVLRNFDLELEKEKYELLPIYAAIQASNEDKIGFRAKNAQELLEKVQNLAWAWGAFVHFEPHNWGDMYKEIEKTPLLLSNLAQELRTYGLNIWTWKSYDNLVSGFISRAADENMIKRLAEN